MHHTHKSQAAKLLINLYAAVTLLLISASWAAMSYPEIQSVVLDASFDDLLPLALKVMPDSWSESSGVQINIVPFDCAAGVEGVEVFALAFRAAGAAHSPAVHEPQQRRAASQVSYVSQKSQFFFWEGKKQFEKIVCMFTHLL